MNSMYNQQWPGHSQPEMAEILRELVEHMPQVPVKKIVKGVKSLLITSPLNGHDEGCAEGLPSQALTSEC